MRLTPAVVVQLEITEGGDVEMRIDGALSPAVVRQPEQETLIQRLREFRGRMPDEFRFDRGEANSE
jgi:antitoxin MazE